MTACERKGREEPSKCQGRAPHSLTLARTNAPVKSARANVMLHAGVGPNRRGGRWGSIVGRPPLLQHAEADAHARRVCRPRGGSRFPGCVFVHRAAMAALHDVRGRVQSVVPLRPPRCLAPTRRRRPARRFVRGRRGRLRVAALGMCGLELARLLREWCVRSRPLPVAKALFLLRPILLGRRLSHPQHAVSCRRWLRCFRSLGCAAFDSLQHLLPRRYRLSRADARRTTVPPLRPPTSHSLFNRTRRSMGRPTSASGFRPKRSPRHGLRRFAGLLRPRGAWFCTTHPSTRTPSPTRPGR
jgi:hypothetical protein